MSIDRLGPTEDELDPLSSVERIAREHKEYLEWIERVPFKDLGQKAELVLVLLGEQPATNFRFRSKDPNTDTFVDAFKKMGLSVIVEQTSDNSETNVFVARTQELAEKIARYAPRTSQKRYYHEEYGQLMGFPQTAIDSFLGRTEKLPQHAAWNLFKSSNFLFTFSHSKDHWKEEEQHRLRRAKIIERFTPSLYKAIKEEHDKLLQGGRTDTK